MKRVTAYINRWLDKIIHSALRGNNETYRSAKILGWTAVATIAMSVVSIPLGIIGNVPSNGLAAFIFIAFQFVILLLLKKGVSVSISGNIFLSIAYIFLAVYIGLTGGLKSPNTPLLCIVPLIAMLIASLRSMVFWIVITITTCLVLLVLHKSGVVFSETFSPEAKLIFLAYLYSVIILFVSALIFVSEKSRRDAQDLLMAEKMVSESLLLNILPEETARELKTYGQSTAKHYKEVTVLFADFAGFTEIAEKLEPQELVAEIDEYFSAFDTITEKYRLEKIKTIGDCYMAAGGLPVANNTHAMDAVGAAIEFLQCVSAMPPLVIPVGEADNEEGVKFTVRIGIHTGSVVAGVVGTKKFQYDIWGDTVNIASRMESSSEVGKVNISETTYQLVKDKFKCEYRGEIEAKGKGKVKMYFVENSY